MYQNINNCDLKRGVIVWYNSINRQKMRNKMVKLTYWGCNSVSQGGARHCEKQE